MLPGFMIIGAMKAGTTSLYRYIASHPDIVTTPIKETDFFAYENHYRNRRAWYESLFDGGGKHAFEASTNYSKRHILPGVPERMHALLPRVKLIYILRDPLKRIASHYLHNYASGGESRPFSDIVKNTNNNYVLTSKYYYQLEAFLEYYPQEQLYLVESEKLFSDSTAAVNGVFRFLGISPDYDSDLLSRRFHVSNVKKRSSSLERKLLSKTQSPLLRLGVKVMTYPLRTSIEQPVLSTEQTDRLHEALAPDVERLRRYSGMPFASWSI